MAILFFLIGVLGFIGLIIGLVKPEKVIRWGKTRTRGRAVLTYFNVMAFSWLIFVFMVAPPESEQDNAATAPPPPYQGPVDTRRPNPSQYPLEWKTKQGYYLASLSKELLDKAIGFATKNDLQALDNMIKAELVFPLKAGLTVFLEDGSALGSYVKIRPKGSNLSFFTVREALTK